jgi:Domain of unknown function (DUF4926)
MLARDAQKLRDLSLGPAGRRNHIFPQQCAGMGRAAIPVAPFRDLSGALMTEKRIANSKPPDVLDVVAVLTDLPADGLLREQVGTVVESLDETAVLVEFSDDQGRAYAVPPCARSDLVVLHYMPKAA